MNREELIQEIRYSLPNKRMLDVVAFGGVIINSKMVTLKNRYGDGYIFHPDSFVNYNEPYFKKHDLMALEKKNVVFGADVFGRRGLLAMVKLAELNG